MPRESWQTGLRRKAVQVSQKTTHVPTLLCLASLLEGIAAEVREKAVGEHTRILTENPEMPIKYFAACIGLSYEVGSKLYKKWHKRAGLVAPRASRASAGEQAFWLGIVAKETAPK